MRHLMDFVAVQLAYPTWRHLLRAIATPFLAAWLAHGCSIDDLPAFPSLLMLPEASDTRAAAAWPPCGATGLPRRPPAPPAAVAPAGTAWRGDAAVLQDGEGPLSAAEQPAALVSTAASRLVPEDRGRVPPEGLAEIMGISREVCLSHSLPSPILAQGCSLKQVPREPPGCLDSTGSVQENGHACAFRSLPLPFGKPLLSNVLTFDHAQCQK